MFLSDLPLTNEHSSTENLLGPPQSYASSPSVRATAASFGVGLAMWDLCSWNTFLVSSKVSQGDQERKLCDIWKEQVQCGSLWSPFSPPWLDTRGSPPGTHPRCHQVLFGCRECCHKGSQPFFVSSASLELNRQKAGQVCLSLWLHIAPLPQPTSQFLIPATSSYPSSANPVPILHKGPAFLVKPWRNNAAVCLAPVLAEDWIESASLGIVLMRGWPIENGELLEQLLNNEEF